MKTLLDTNIIIDYALERIEFVDNARKIMHKAFDNEIDAFISASAVTDIYYLVQKYKSKEQALSFLLNIISFIEIIGVDKLTVIQALNSNFTDFEDAVQNYSAVNAGVEFIITRNPKDFANSELKVFEPLKFIEFLEGKM